MEDPVWLDGDTVCTATTFEAAALAAGTAIEAALADGRFAAEAEDLRLFRRIATMDASAPLPPLAETSPVWAEASSFLERLGLAAVAGRVGALKE